MWFIERAWAVCGFNYGLKRMRIMNVVCLMCYYQAVARHFEGNKRSMRSLEVCVTHLEKTNSLLLIHRKF